MIHSSPLMSGISSHKGGQAATVALSRTVYAGSGLEKWVQKRNTAVLKVADIVRHYRQLVSLGCGGNEHIGL
jgi:hypothetical protein